MSYQRPLHYFNGQLPFRVKHQTLGIYNHACMLDRERIGLLWTRGPDPALSISQSTKIFPPQGCTVLLADPFFHTAMQDWTHQLPLSNSTRRFSLGCFFSPSQISSDGHRLICLMSYSYNRRLHVSFFSETRSNDTTRFLCSITEPQDSHLNSWFQLPT